ncbi:Electron transfer flavoprotein domain-containing protein [Mesorhizobium sp. YR577]|nr:Electron transfer flavoprotein domain-containing protein [Mesorhizobium sp. YR577]
MTILLLAEHDITNVSDQTAKTLTAAAKIAEHQGSDVHVLVAGSGAKAAPDAAAKLSGVSKVTPRSPTIWPSRSPRRSSRSRAPTT